MSAILALVLVLALVFGLAGKLIYDGIKEKENRKIVRAIAVLAVFAILVVMMMMAGK